MRECFFYIGYFIYIGIMGIFDFRVFWVFSLCFRDVFFFYFVSFLG